MVNDSSLDMNLSFNLDSQTELMQLLVSVRASDLTTVQKNELRDLVFLYINGGKDNSVRIALEQKVVAYSIKKVQTANAVAQATPPAFGNYRPAPVFATATVSQSVPVQTAPVPPTSVPVVPPPPIPQVEIPVAPAPVVAPSVPVPPPIAPAPVAVVPPPAPVVPVPVTPIVSEVIVPTPTPEPPVVAENTIPVDPNVNLDRIREIKSRVNEKVGNPVNLVDINNEVGREYMSALLDAMKKVGSGSSAISAMKRLEDAFVLVEKTLDEHNKSKNSETVAPQVKSVTTITAPAVTVPISVTVEPKVIAPVIEEVKPLVSVPVKPEPVIDVPVIESPVPNNLPTQKEFVPIAEEFNQKEEKVAYEAPKTEIESDWGPATDTLVKNVPINTPSSPAGIVSLAQSKIKLRTPEELVPASSIETSSVAGDPLFTREVDDGLHQLLSEWSIFKKSGLFGTGPKGKDHPLYKKISSLPIPLLLAGRFEGATQEIKQSVTDYMNGWRYEQGIIYEQGENFEHYLRRVIRHILDLQNKKRPS